MSKGRNAALAGLALGLAIGAARRVRTGRATAAAARGGASGRRTTVTTDDGVRLAVEIDDHPDPRCAVVFAHGWLMNRHCWRLQREALAGLGTLVFYDQRGHGDSSAGPLETCTIDRLGDDLAAVIEAAVPEGLPVVLAGHSMGGMTIMALADRHPGLVESRVAGAALLSTSSGGLAATTFNLPGPLGRLAPRVTTSVFESMLARAAVIDARPRLKGWTNLPVTRYVAFGKGASARHVRVVNAMAAATPTEVMVGFFRDFRVHDKHAALEALKRVQTLVMVGERDRLTPLAHGRRIAEALPDARFVRIPDAGHMIGYERTELVNRELAGLIMRAVADRTPGRSAA
ncbi:lipase [Microbispora rosea subsp. aerata]|nr:alpha/beta hydrolase [Microbispora rosea]GGO13872.1 lipase [Microbispora rosea subsp. aerata]GIH53925.1 lipase [Microbispora rosea subsp. aerata]GLJ84898.1 lipase [Microbispora rosea subsp. aerata]